MTDWSGKPPEPWERSGRDEPAEHPDLRRLRALTRDEHRLRTAVAAQEARRFDLNTAQILRERTEDLLETIGVIAADDDFWGRLEHAAAEPLTGPQLERLSGLDESTLAVLLEFCGYRSPPPPTVLELVDDTLADLALAVRAGAAAPTRVRAAQQSLILFTMRVRRQIAELEPTPLEPSMLRTSARQAGRAARWLLPKLAAAGAGALAEKLTADSGLGLVVSSATHKLAEDSVELAARLAAARLPDVSEPDRRSLTNLPEPPDPVRLHAAALLDQLVRLRRDKAQNGPYVLPGAWEVDLARTTARHLDRLAEVLTDSGRYQSNTWHALEDIRCGIEHYTGSYDARGSIELLYQAIHAAEWLTQQ